MKAIGVTSHSLRGYVAGRRGYVALPRGYVARVALNPLFFLRFFNCFRPLPFFYPLSTSSPCGQLLASPTPTSCNGRRPAPSARRATGSPTLWAGESYRTGPYRLGGCAASLHGAASTVTICQRANGLTEKNHRPSIQWFYAASRQTGFGKLLSLIGARHARAASGPKGAVAGSRWAGAEPRPSGRGCPHPCGVGSAAVHGRARADRRAEHLAALSSIEERATLSRAPRNLSHK